MTVGEAVAVFLDDRRRADRRPDTLRSYGSQLRRFHRFALDQRGREPLFRRSGEMVEDYLEYLTADKSVWDDNEHVRAQQRRLSPASVAVAYRTLKAWFNRMQRLGYIDFGENPFALGLVDHRSPPDDTPGYLSEYQIAHLLRILEQSRLAVRNVPLFLILLDTGARVGEILGARLIDLDRSRRIIRVTGKRRRQREVPFSFQTAERLQVYFCTRTDLGPSAPIFAGRNGRPLTYAAARMVLRRAFETAEIEMDRCGLHMLRHTFGRRYLQNGGDLASLSQILGHTSITTTMIYARMITPDLQEKHQRCSPVAALFAREGCEDPPLIVREVVGVSAPRQGAKVWEGY